jgi:hypothetical protein
VTEELASVQRQLRSRGTDLPLNSHSITALLRIASGANIRKSRKVQIICEGMEFSDCQRLLGEPPMAIFDVTGVSFALFFDGHINISCDSNDRVLRVKTKDLTQFLFSSEYSGQ